MIINNSNGPDGLTAFPGGMLWSPLGQVFVGNFVGNKHRLPSQNDKNDFFEHWNDIIKSHEKSSKVMKSHFRSEYCPHGPAFAGLATSDPSTINQTRNKSERLRSKTERYYHPAIVNATDSIGVHWCEFVVNKLSR